MATLTQEEAIERLRTDRKKYVEDAARGKPEALAAIEFIDRMLTTLVPGYIPGK